MRAPVLAALLVPAAVAQRLPPAPPPLDGGVLECVIEYQPELVGGMAALQAAVVYPTSARADGVEGQVIVQFVVEADGTVTEPLVVRSPDDRLSEAALAAVRRMQFRPGRQRDEAARMRFAVPVTFRLD